MKKDNDKNMKLMHVASLVAKFSLCEIEFFCLCAGTPELEKACHKFSDAHKNLNYAIQNILKNKNTKSLLLHRDAEIYLDKLDDFYCSAAVKDERLKSVIKDLQEVIRELIS